MDFNNREFIAATTKEIQIRGTYLMMACDIEYCLLNIIMFCNPNPNNHERAGRFKEMKMNAKVQSVIADMKKYKPQYYFEFKEYFDGLDNFRIIRNDMSHCKGDFPKEPDLSIFRIIFVDKTETGQEAIKYRDYTDEFIKQSINEFAEINLHLSALWIRLSEEFNSQNNPFLKKPL